MRAYEVDLGETVPPAGSFPSFDAFFTRAAARGRAPRLRADPDAIVSPADGRLEDAGPVHAGGAHIKGRAYAVADLVGDPAEVARYEGGQFAIVYLSPRDYHRVHAPVAGRVTLVRSMPGDYFPVNSIGERHVDSLFSINRRVAIAIDTPAHGRVTVVMVGAMIVGRITVSAIDARDVPLGVHVIAPGLARRPRRRDRRCSTSAPRRSSSSSRARRRRSTHRRPTAMANGRARRILVGEPLDEGDRR